MNVSRIADKSRPDYWPRRIKAIEDAVAKLRTARSANATEVDGTFTVDGDLNVTANGALTVNPSGVAIALDTGKDSNGDPVATASFTSLLDPAVTVPAQIQLQDGQPPFIAVQSPAAGRQVSVLALDYESAHLSANDGTGSCELSLTPAGGVEIGFHGGGIMDIPNASNIDFDYTTNARLGAASGELRALQFETTGTYIPIRASSFPTGSSRAVKTDISAIPFDSTAAISAAKAQQWRYLPEYATEDLTHIGPMAEDLPADLVHTSSDGVVSVDLLSLVGVLWDAVGKLAGRVAALEGGQLVATNPPAQTTTVVSPTASEHGAGNP